MLSRTLECILNKHLLLRQGCGVQDNILIKPCLSNAKTIRKTPKTRALGVFCALFVAHHDHALAVPVAPCSFHLWEAKGVDSRILHVIHAEAGKDGVLTILPIFHGLGFHPHGLEVRHDCLYEYLFLAHVRLYHR